MQVKDLVGAGPVKWQVRAKDGFIVGTYDQYAQALQVRNHTAGWASIVPLVA